MHTNSKKIRLTLLAAAIATTLSAHAQEGQAVASKPPAQDQSAAGDKMQKVEVVGNAQTYDPRRDDTATKVVISSEEIRKYGDTNVLDVLKRVPGVTVSGAGGRGGEIRMRGLGSGYTQILINGERAPAGFSMDSLSPDVIERIEVLRAASAEFSTQAVAGTINIVLKKAVKAGQRELKAGVGHGHGYLNPVLNLQLSDKAGKLSWSVAANAMHQKQDNTTRIVEEGFDPAGKRVRQLHTADANKTRFSTVNISPRLNWNLEGGDTLTWQTFINANRFAIDGNSAVSVQPGSSAPTFTRAEMDMVNKNTMLRSDLNWAHRLASGSRLDLKVGGLLLDLYNKQRRFGYTPAGVQGLDSVVDSEGMDKGMTSTGKYTNPLIDGHTLALGWDGGYTVRDDSRKQHDTPMNGFPGIDTDEQYKGRVKRFAAYAQDEWNITKLWSLYLGVRWEGIETNTSGNTFDGSRSRSSVWSPVMQTLLKLPNSKDQVRFAVTRTYKAPNVQSLIPRRFMALNNSQTEPDFQGNPDLKPELALGLDAAYEKYWAEGALFSVSASTRRIEDYTRNMTSFRDGRWVLMPSNAGKARTYGLELEAKFPLKAVMDNALPVDVRASVSRNWSTVESVPGPNNRLDQQTPVSANFGIDYKAGPLTTGASFSFRNGGPVQISANQTAYQSVRRDLEAYALWKFNPKHQLRVAVSNVLGQDFINASTYTDARGTSNRTAIYPAYLVVRATMEMKF